MFESVESFLFANKNFFFSTLFVFLDTHADGRPRGFGHVEFSSKENAIACFTSAMEEPIFFAGRDLVIDYAKGSSQKGGGADAEPNNRLYFNGCKEGEVELKDVFAGHAQNIISIYFCVYFFSFFFPCFFLLFFFLFF